MTTIQKLTAQLQAAWQAAAQTATAAESTDRDRPLADVPVQTQLSTHLRKRCVSHFNSDDWIRTPIPDRPGWWKSHCRLCGVFIGNAPAPDNRKHSILESTATAAPVHFSNGLFDRNVPDSG